MAEHRHVHNDSYLNYVRTIYVYYILYYTVRMESTIVLHPTHKHTHDAYVVLFRFYFIVSEGRSGMT